MAQPPNNTQPVPPPPPISLTHVIWMKWEETAAKIAEYTSYVFIVAGVAAVSLIDGFPAIALALTPVLAVAAIVIAASVGVYYLYKWKLESAKEENAAAILDHLRQNNTTQGLVEHRKHGVYFKSLEVDCSQLPVEADKSVQVTTFFNNVREVFPRLTTLTLKSFNCHDDVFIGMLAQLPLESLTLKDCQLTDEQLQSIANIPTLKKLKIDSCGKFTDAGVKALENLDLEEVEIKEKDVLELNEIGKQYIQCVKKWTHLKTLSLDNANDDFVTDVLIYGKALETLSLANCKELTGECFAEELDGRVKKINFSGFLEKWNVIGFTHLCARQNLEAVTFDLKYYENRIMDQATREREFAKFRKVFKPNDKDEVTFNGFWRHRVNYKG